MYICFCIVVGVDVVAPAQTADVNFRSYKVRQTIEPARTYSQPVTIPLSPCAALIHNSVTLFLIVAAEAVLRRR